MNEKFNRVNLILQNIKYKNLLTKLNEFEKDRAFCRHTMEHFLDTARIMYIISLEENLQISKDIIYASALLHDIGRTLQYEKNIPHDIASADFAEKILPECGFEKSEVLQITNAIKSHREKSSELKENILGSLLYRADKLSRNCFNCSSEKECYWEKDKKNFKILY